MLLASLARVVSAQQSSTPSVCPNVASLKPASVNTTPKTADRIASDKLVAEGRAATRTLSGESVAKSISLFEQAVRADPKNATAYISLGRAHTQSQRYMSVPKKTARARAQKNLSKGLELDPATIDGLHLLADQVIASNGEPKCARRILEAALKLDPKNGVQSLPFSIAEWNGRIRSRI